MSAINRLDQEKARAAQDALSRLKFKAPTVWQHVQDAMRAKSGVAGLGDYSLSDFLDLTSTVVASKTISSDERKAAELELKMLREKNALIEQERKLEIELQREKNAGLTLAQKSGLLGDSILGQFMQKPWALPALLGLGAFLVRSVTGRRKR